MTDYIKREDAINKFATIVAGNSYERISDEVKHETAVKFFEDIPTADVRENVRGEWINKGFMVAECSNCKEQFHELEIANFCPNCGAQMMRGEQNG